MIYFGQIQNITLPYYGLTFSLIDHGLSSNSTKKYLYKDWRFLSLTDSLIIKTFKLKFRQKC